MNTKTKPRLSSLVIGVILTLMLLTSVFLAGCSCARPAPGEPETAIPTVDQEKVYQLFVDEEGTQWVATLTAYNAAVEGEGPLKAIAIGSNSTEPKIVAGKATSVAVLAYDPMAVGREAADSVPAAAATPAAAVSNPLSWLAPKQAYADTPANFDIDAFSARFFEIWQEKHPELNIVPSTVVTAGAQIRASESGQELSHIRPDGSRDDTAYNSGLAKGSTGENLANVWSDVTPEELYAMWEASPGHNLLLTSVGSTAVYYGLGFYFDEYGSATVSLNVYEANSGRTVENPDTQKGVDPPAWYAPKQQPEPIEQDQPTETINPDPETPAESVPEEPEAIEVEPVLVANPEDVIPGFPGAGDSPSGAEAADDTSQDATPSIGWPEDAVIDVTPAKPGLELSPGLENPVRDGDNTYQIPAGEGGSVAGDGPAAEVELIDTDGLTNDEPTDYPNKKPGGEDSVLNAGVVVSDAWWEAVQASVQAKLDSGDWEAALGTISLAQGLLFELATKEQIAEKLGGLEEQAKAQKAAAEAAEAKKNDNKNDNSSSSKNKDKQSGDSSKGDSSDSSGGDQGGEEEGTTSEIVDIPNIYGQTEETAKEWLTKAGLKWKIEDITNPYVTVGRVSAMDPTGSVERGSTITVWISR